MCKKFDYNILNPLEFEEFCKDVMKFKYNISLKSFAPGRDNGIDLRNYDKKIICQCKRIVSFSNLKSTLKDEVLKVKKLYDDGEVKDYYLLITNKLTPKQEKDILNIMKPYLNSDNLISSSELDDILEDNSNLEILRRNFKLWLTSSSILQMFNNKFMLFKRFIIFDDIKNYSKYFVETKKFFSAYEIFENKHCVVLTGVPGIGKTITSYMILSKFLINHSDYSIKTTSIDKIDKLIEGLDKSEKEIIIIDDFLGKNILDLNDKELETFSQVIQYCKIFKKYLLLNSRTYILKQAEEENDNLKRKVSLIPVVDISEFNAMEKAKILFNIQYYNKVPNEYYNNLKDKNIFYSHNYLPIIYHRNFNPRIIEYCAHNFENDSIKSSCYSKYILENLENPEVVWKNQFNKFTDEEKLFLNIMFISLKNNVSSNIMLNTFEKACKNRSINVDSNIFYDIIAKFNNSLIKTSNDKGMEYLSFINPSVSDYILNNLNQIECNKLVYDCCYIEQLYKIIKINACGLDKINYDLFTLKTIEYNSINDGVLSFVYEFNFGSELIKDKLNELISKKRILSSEVLKIISNKNLIEFYNLNNILDDFDYISNLIEISSYDTVKKFVRNVDEFLFEKDEEYINDYVKNFKANTDSLLINIIENEASTYYCDVDSVTSAYKEDLEIKVIDEDPVCTNFDEIKGIILEQLKDEIEEAFQELKDDLRFDYINYDNLYLNAYNCINENEIDNSLDDIIFYSYSENSNSETIERNIDDIFNQYYDF